MNVYTQLGAISWNSMPIISSASSNFYYSTYELRHEKIFIEFLTTFF